MNIYILTNYVFWSGLDPGTLVVSEEAVDGMLDPHQEMVRAYSHEYRIKPWIKVNSNS